MSDKNVTLEVPVTRTADGRVDQEAFRKSAERIGSEYVQADEKASEAVIDATEKVLSSGKGRHFTAGTLARMAVGLLPVIPTDKIVADAEVRVRSFLSGREDLLHITNGRHSGFHVKSLYTADELAKLQPSKA